MPLNKILIILFTITGVSYSQFANVEISLDLRNISKFHIKELRKTYFDVAKKYLFVAEKNNKMQI